MENNNRDFLKNRPVVKEANQYQDVYGSQKKSTFTTVSAVLAVVMFVFTLISWINNNLIFKTIFTPVFILLLISFVVSFVTDRKNRPVVPDKDLENSESIFKDHDV